MIEQAFNRVLNDEQLSQYADVILYDWNEEDHWEWVAIAPVAEIMDWAASVDFEDEEATE